MPVDIPQVIQESLVKELRKIAEMMREEPDLTSKLYFFSAAYGAVRRTINIAWSNELVLLHVVLQASHNTISARLNQLKAGQDQPITLPEGLPGRLADLTDKLADTIASEQLDRPEFLDILAELATLAFSTTGNGYYLYLKGDLKI